MTLQQAVGVVMEANIGTTLNAQLIAFNFSEIAYLFVFIGVMGMFVAQPQDGTLEQRYHGFWLAFCGLGRDVPQFGLAKFPLGVGDPHKVSSNPSASWSAGLTMIIKFIRLRGYRDSCQSWSHLF